MLSVLNSFSHGYVIAPVVRACVRRALFESMASGTALAFGDLVNRLQANSGHLRVALRLLESLGWVVHDEGDHYRLCEKSAAHRDIPEDIVQLLDFSFQHYLTSPGESTGLDSWLQRSINKWSGVDSELETFLDGLIVLPLLLAALRHRQVA